MECAAQGPSCPWTNVLITAPTLPARRQTPVSPLESSVLRVSGEPAGEGRFWAAPFYEREGCIWRGTPPYKNPALYTLQRGRGESTPSCPHPSAVTSNTPLPSWVQPHQTCCCTRHWCRRPPTSRTGPCTCCTVPRKRTAWPTQHAPPTGPTATAVYSDSPPRFTTWDELTSGPRLGATLGCGTSAMGEWAE